MRFVLVPGGYHGAWCWSKLTPELEALGHGVLALDLPGSGEQMGVKATHASWRDAFREVIEEGDVVVGHSQGGFAISLAADEVSERVARLIYLSAAVPVEGEPMSAAVGDVNADQSSSAGEAFEDFTEYFEDPVQGLCIRLTNADAVAKLFYHDCTPEDQAWAYDHLKPLPIGPTLEPFHLSRFWSTAIPRDFILCTDDRSHPVAKDNVFMERLGLSSCFSVVSSHSPFLSRPADTAKLLDRCAQGTLDNI